MTSLPSLMAVLIRPIPPNSPTMKTPGTLVSKFSLTFGTLTVWRASPKVRTIAGVGAFLLHRGDMDVPNGQGGAAQRAEGRALGDGLTAPRTWPQAHRGADSDGPARTRDRLLGGRQLFDVAPDKEERDEQGNEKCN